MQFRSESIIHHPVDAVFATYRDRLPEVVAYLDDIREVIVRSREAQGDVVRLHNEWIADREIPKVAQAFIKPEHLRWDDFAAWDEPGRICRWEIRPHAFRDAVKVTGTNRFEAHGGGTRVVLEGVFDIDGKAIPGIPSLLARTVVPQVEKFIVALIQPNLEKVNEAVGSFLDAQA